MSYEVFSTIEHRNPKVKWENSFDTVDEAAAYIAEILLNNGADEYDTTEGYLAQLLYDTSEVRCPVTNNLYEIVEVEE